MTAILTADVTQMFRAIESDYAGAAVVGVWTDGDCDRTTIGADHILIDLGRGALGVLGVDDEAGETNWPSVVEFIDPVNHAADWSITDFATYSACGVSALLTVMAHN